MKNLFLLSISFLISASALADFTLAKNTKCKVFSDNPKQTINWHGDCKDGFADGLGVVRYLSGAKVESVFFGQLKAGYWELGALDQDGGYIAGKFEKNKRIEVKNADGVEDRNITIKAFETASKAALKLSEEFTKLGNKASAIHYTAESEKLAQQME